MQNLEDTILNCVVNSGVSIYVVTFDDHSVTKLQFATTFGYFGTFQSHGLHEAVPLKSLDIDQEMLGKQASTKNISESFNGIQVVF